MENYSWALNEVKLQRAKVRVGPNATEDEIKGEYLKLGGLIGQKRQFISHAPQQKLIKDSLEYQPNPVSVDNESIAIPKPK